MLPYDNAMIHSHVLSMVVYNRGEMEDEKAMMQHSWINGGTYWRNWEESKWKVMWVVKRKRRYEWRRNKGLGPSVSSYTLLIYVSGYMISEEKDNAVSVKQHLNYEI